MEIIWDIMQEITSKKDWYTKVFNREMIAKWRTELPQAGSNFDLALKLLQASAQGTNHVDGCDWEEGPMCKGCCEDIENKVRANPAELLEEDQDVDDFLEDYFDNNECDHPRCNCLPPNHFLESYTRYHPEGLLSPELHARCQSVIAEMAAQEPIDWHPSSNQQVRDLIHPSMYCYVKGVSKHLDGKADSECDESVRYQWMPSEFHIGDKVEITSYVNNLDQQKYPKMIPLLEEVFEQFMPSLEAVLKWYLKGKNLQVIVKVGQILLTKEQHEYPGGSWHIEGMPHEHIAATCIHYVDVKGITDSFLEFRKPTILNEENIDYPQSDHVYTTHHYGIEPRSHHEGVMNRYLGLIRCHEGASVVFPNTLQHRVKEFALAPGEAGSLRTILAFFVIDPNRRIVSTANIPPQQGLFSLEEAQHHRERLMVHRKYFVNKLNEVVFERPFSLCEH